MKKLMLPILFICTLWISCDEKLEFIQQEPFTSEVDEEIKSQIFSLGFDTTDIVLLSNNEYLVEGDIILTKEHFIQTRQARTPDRVSSTRACNIKIGIHSSIPTTGVGAQWREAIREAVREWNIATRFIGLGFSLSDTNPDIWIRNANNELASNTMAAASFPSNGNPGNLIRINFNYRASNLSQKIYAMVHEIGHCIGLRHTNWAALGESPGIQIPGTPATDPNSVMNGGTALQQWQGFSNYDKEAIRRLYPIFYPVEFYTPPFTEEQLGQIFTIIAEVSAIIPKSYYWDILPPKGTIIRGQGTNQLTFRLDELPFGLNLDVTDNNNKTYSWTYYDGHGSGTAYCR